MEANRLSKEEIETLAWLATWLQKPIAWVFCWRNREAHKALERALAILRMLREPLPPPM